MSDGEVELAPESGSQDETIEKLRQANKQLRSQLKEFSKSLDASLAATADGGDSDTAGGSARDREAVLLERRRLMKGLAGKEKQLRGVQKKLEIYKKANTELTKQVGNTYNQEKLTALQQERDEKQTMITQLQEENRTLLQIQRNQAKQIQEQEAMKSEWPAKVSSLMADLRVSKERVRKAKDRETKAQELTKRQHEQMLKLADKNKRLQSQLLEYERNQGSSLADKQKKKLMAQWRDEKEKLNKSIAVLEKSKQQERTKGERLLRANVAELQKVKKEMEKHRSQLEEKEKEIRLQLLQVRKLKRQLRELALGEAGASQLTKGWSGQASSTSVAASRRVTSGKGSDMEGSPKARSKERAGAGASEEDDKYSDEEE